MDQPKQKRVWIDQDIIDGPYCNYSHKRKKNDGFFCRDN